MALTSNNISGYNYMVLLKHVASNMADG